jgi:hypothetical protein
MASMSTEIALLRALLRLSRRASAVAVVPPASSVSLAGLVSAVREDEREVERALASLARQQLVLRAGEGVRLSMPGLAVAVAVTARDRRASSHAAEGNATGRPSARVFPLPARVRRHRAA